MSEFFSRVSYGRIVARDGNEVQLTDENGFTWWMDNAGTAMSVTFHKKAEPKRLFDLVKALLLGQEPAGTDTALKRKLAAAVLGEERTLQGRHFNKMNEHGRLEFFDMAENTMKQIDPRTITKAIVKGTLYTIK
jgi:hypothetical protein